MARFTPAEVTAKWKNRLKMSTPEIQAGIDKVTIAPGVKAARQADVMVRKVQEAVTSGRWARKVAAVSVDDWKKAAKEKGLNRISAGVDAASDKHEKMAEQLLKNVDEALAEVNKTPRGDLEANIQRSVTMQREMAKRKIG